MNFCFPSHPSSENSSLPPAFFFAWLKYVWFVSLFFKKYWVIIQRLKTRCTWFWINYHHFFLKPSISCLTVERIDSSLNNSMRLGPTLNPFGLAMQDFGKIHSDRCCHWKSFAFIYILIHLYGMSLSLSTHCLYSYLCLTKLVVN